VKQPIDEGDAPNRGGAGNKEGPQGEGMDCLQIDACAECENRAYEHLGPAPSRTARPMLPIPAKICTGLGPIKADSPDDIAYTPGIAQGKNRTVSSTGSLDITMLINVH